MAEKLTDQQRCAVENQGGKLLVSAAAGSGKTKVLVDRLMRYIQNPVDPANIDDFLIITYTKAAAGELRGKIAAKLSSLIAENPGDRHLQQQMQRLYLSKISTVHGFCTDILRQYAYRLDIAGDFRVADERECAELQIKAMEQVLNDAYEQAGEDMYFRNFADSQGLGRDDRQIPEIVLKVYTSAKCHLNPTQWLNWCVDSMASQVSGAEETAWGIYLIADLKRYLVLQIEAMERCVQAAAQTENMEKPVALFGSTIEQMKKLLACNTWNEILENKDIQFGTLTFSKKCTDQQLIDQMKAIRNACKDGLKKYLIHFEDSSEQVLADIARTAVSAKGLVNLVLDFDKCYSAIKKKRGIVDFSDLEHYTLDLLLGKQRSGPTAIASEVADCFREVMVDEYQDSNEIQDAIFNALTYKKQNCFMVGDVKQSIYQFRLANPGIFIEKYNTYAPADQAAAGEGRRVLLNHNFRSSAGVIEGVNAVFSRCMSTDVGGLPYGEEEMLCEGIPHTELPDPEISLYGIQVDNDTYGEEATFVADTICDLLDGTHYVRDKDDLRLVTPEDIVILLRSPGSVGGEFYYALQKRGVRCFAGDQGDLLQTEEIITTRALLEVINNPLQDIPLAAVLTSPVFGFTADDLAVLRSEHRSADLYTLVANGKSEKCVRFREKLERLRTISRLSTVTELLSAIYTETNLLGIYSAMPNGGERLNNLQNFFQITSDYETNGPKELSRFLDYLRSAEARGLSGTDTQQGSGVTIMSIHKSKGLEFPVVFLCGLSRGFNRDSVRGPVLCDKDLGLGLGCVDTELRVRYPTIARQAISVKMQRESVSEELRVLYVAMTRARDRLIMTYAAKNLQGKLQELATRLHKTPPVLLSAEVDCPGDWVLQTALTRTEAGEFFDLGGNPECACVMERPWEINVAVADPKQGIQTISHEFQQEIKALVMEKLQSAFGFCYQHLEATQIPSKLTATQLKGRELDHEIAEGTVEHKVLAFRKAGITSGIKGKARGNAVHTVLQYINFSKCGSVDDICVEVRRMIEENRISSEQAALVDCKKIAGFFATDMGLKLRDAKNVLREFKFSILDDATKYYADARGEQILFQGVVDCAILEDDGVTVLDFKTDYVTEETLQAVVNSYKGQVTSYADALSRIYKRPIKTALLYFFSLDRIVTVI